MINALTIGQVVSQTGVSHDTIRLYERYGLIDAPPRASNGYRQYAPEIVDRLLFIIQTKQMGFTLKEIGELLSIHETSPQSCGEVRYRTQEKLSQVAQKINELKKLEQALKELMQDCEQHTSNDLCPIFMTLSKAETHNHG